MVEDLHAKFDRSTWLKVAWKKCNKGGGSRIRMFMERDAVGLQESSQCKEEEAEGAHAKEASTRPERSTHVVLYTVQYVQILH